MQSVANLFPPQLGLDDTLEQNASALQLLEHFSPESILHIKTSFQTAVARRRVEDADEGQPFRASTKPIKVSVKPILQIQSCSSVTGCHFDMC